MEIKAGVFDRIGQTFEILFSKYFFLLTSLATIYGVVNYILFSLSFHFLTKLALKEEVSSIESVWAIFYKTEFIEIVISFMIIFILMSFVYLGILAGTIKIIKDLINNEIPKKLEEYFFYGWNKIIPMMYLYFYSFMYIILIPFIILIIGSLITVVLYVSGQNQFIGTFTGITLGGFFLTFIILSIYRGIKSSFFLMRGIGKEDYTKEGFDKAVNLSEGNWWRIVGNMILISIVISLLSSIVNGVISSIGLVTGGQGMMSLLEKGVTGGQDIKNPEQLKVLLNGLLVTNPISYFIGILKVLLNSIGTICILIFLYIFYKRIEQEKETPSNP